MFKLHLLILPAFCLALTSSGSWAADAGNTTATADAGSSSDGTTTEIVGDAGTSLPGYFSDGGVNPSVSIDATVTITSPNDNETFTNQVVAVSFDVEGCEMSGPSSNPLGCHIHRFVDSVGYSEDGESKIGYYNSAPTSMIIPTSGTHTIKFVLHRNDGTDLAFEPEISDEVTIVLDLPEPSDDDDDEDDNGDADADEDDNKSARQPEESGCGCNAAQNNQPWVTFASVLVFFFAALRRRRQP